MLYLLNNNISLGAFYERLSETLQRLGIDEALHFPIIRLYSVDGGLGSGLEAPCRGPLVLAVYYLREAFPEFIGQKNA